MPLDGAAGSDSRYVDSTELQALLVVRALEIACVGSKG